MCLSSVHSAIAHSSLESHFNVMINDRGEPAVNLVTDEPDEVQDFRRITDYFRGVYRIYPNLMKENRRMSTCNRLDLQTLGSQPVMMSKNLPEHWS